MFIQVRPWLDCDRNCSFCYLSDSEKHTDIQYKRKALMNIMKILGDESLQDEDVVGLIGGELFCFEGLNAEWRCVADIICSIHPKIVCLGTHLLSGVDRLLKFARMLRGKDVQICTSYDSVGRFKDEAEKQLWFANLQKVHDAGFRTIVSCTLTAPFLSDPVEFPEWVELRIQPLFVTEPWLEMQIQKNASTTEYHEDLVANCSDLLIGREAFIKFLSKHKELAKTYATYSDKHATYLYDFDGESYKKNDFICSTHLTECGHPFIARCYKDSEKCTMCDAREVSKW